MAIINTTTSGPPYSFEPWDLASNNGTQAVQIYEYPKSSVDFIIVDDAFLKNYNLIGMLPTNPNGYVFLKFRFEHRLVESPYEKKGYDIIYGPEWLKDNHNSLQNNDVKDTDNYGNQLQVDKAKKADATNIFFNDGYGDESHIFCLSNEQFNAIKLHSTNAILEKHKSVVIRLRVILCKKVDTWIVYFYLDNIEDVPQGVQPIILKTLSCGSGIPGGLSNSIGGTIV